MRIALQSRFAAALQPIPSPFAGVWLGAGWHLHSGDGWSSAPRAVLLLDPEHHRPGSLILLEIEVFNATPQTPRHLAVSGLGITANLETASPGHAAQSGVTESGGERAAPAPAAATVAAAPPAIAAGAAEAACAAHLAGEAQTGLHFLKAIDTALPQWVLVPVPELAPGAALIELALHLSPLASPAALGISPDERLLGLRLRGLEPYAEALEFPLEFSNPNVVNICLGPGWSAPEPSGLWSDGHEARLHLPAWLWPFDKDPALAEPVLEVDCAVLPRPEGAEPLRLRLVAAGVVLTEGSLSAAEPEVLRCPLRGIWPQGQPLELVLQLENPSSPADLGINADPRQLGLFLRRISLTAQGAAAPL